MNQLKRELGLFSCVMLVIGNIIGVGIFTTPGEIAKGLPTAGWVLVAWLVGGLMTMAGALTYAELGAMYPRAGGNYVFLKEAYGDVIAFLYGWAYSLVTTAGTIALLAIGFAEYLGIPGGSATSKIFSITVILVLTFLNARDLKLGAGVMDFITSLKIVAMLLLVLLGFSIGHGDSGNFHPFIAGDAGSAFSAILAALVPMAFTYSGWNSTVIVGEEVKNPEQLIPLSMILGTLGTTAIYMLMNVIYLYAIPLQELLGADTVAHLAATKLFGPGTARLIQALVATSVLGCLSATLLTNPRTAFAMGRDKLFFRFAGEVHPTHATPSKAIWFEGLWACFLILVIGDFDRMLSFVSVPLVIIGAMTVISIFVFRAKQPDQPRPYKCWGYPIVPALYVIVALCMLYVKFVQRSNEFIFGIPISYFSLLLFALGVPVFFLWKKFYADAR